MSLGFQMRKMTQILTCFLTGHMPITEVPEFDTASATPTTGSKEVAGHVYCIFTSYPLCHAGVQNENNYRAVGFFSPVASSLGLTTGPSKNNCPIQVCV